MELKKEKAITGDKKIQRKRSAAMRILACFFCAFLYFILVMRTAGADCLHELHVLCGSTSIRIKGCTPENAKAIAEYRGSNMLDLSVQLGDGSEFQPYEQPLSVTIPSDIPCTVYHLGEDGWDKLDTAWNGTEILFRTDHFSLFAITQSTELLITPDEIQNSLSDHHEIIVLYKVGDRLYDAEEFQNRYHVQLPSGIPTGHVRKHIDSIRQRLMDAQLLGAFGCCSLSVYKDGRISPEIHQVFRTEKGTFYSTLEMNQEDYSEETPGSQENRMRLAMDITEHGNMLQTDEQLVVVLPELNENVPALHSLQTSAFSGNDLAFHILDVQTGLPVSGKLVLYNENEESVWVSDMNAVHVLSSEEGILENGMTYTLYETEVEDGYSVPGFPWTLEVGENAEITVTETTQLGQGKAESLGLTLSENGVIQIRNEKSPCVYLHYQNENDDTERIELLAGNLDTHFEGELVREDYIFLGWSDSPASLNISQDHSIQVSAGYENHLYAVWQEVLYVKLMTYTLGKYQEAEMVEGSLQIPLSSFPVNTNLLNSVCVYQYLDISMLPEDMTIAFESIEAQEIERINHIQKTADPDHALIRWEVKLSDHVLHPIGPGQTMVIFCCPKSVQIPVHVFEFTTNGQYILRDDIWRNEEYESICLDFGTQITDIGNRQPLTPDKINELKCHEVLFGHLDSEEGFQHEKIYTSQTLSYTWAGIFLDEEQIELYPAFAIAYAYFPAIREIPFHIIENVPDAGPVERLEWQKAERISVSCATMPFEGLTAIQALKQATLIDSVLQSVSLDSAYYGNSFEEKAETIITGLQNTPWGISVNSGNVYLKETDALYFIFFENPRTWPVHVIERTAVGYEDRDEEWNVQPIVVSDQRTNIQDFDPRAEADERYALFSIRRCDSTANLSNSTKYKEISKIMNGVDGISLMYMGQTKMNVLKSPQQIFFLYSLKERPINVCYASVQNGTLTPIPASQLELFENGNAVESFFCNDQEYIQPALRDPHWAVLGNDGTPVYYPFVMYAVGTAGIVSTENMEMLSELPWFINAYTVIKQKNTESGKTKNIGLDKQLYVLYDFSQDEHPAYLQIRNSSENGVYTFTLSISEGGYGQPVLTESEWSGTYILPESGRYSLTLGPGDEHVLYIPSGGGLEYHIDVFDEDHLQISDRLDEFDLELSVQPLSAPLEGALKTGTVYYWNDPQQNAFKEMRGRPELTYISIQDKQITVPAPTGQPVYPCSWIIIFAMACISLAIIRHRTRT